MKFSPYASFIRFLYQRLHKRTIVHFDHLWDASIYVGANYNVATPLDVGAYFPMNIHIWVYHVFFTVRKFYQQLISYTFTKRYGWLFPLALVLALPCALLGAPLMRGIRAIPVYRGDRDIVKTARISVDILLSGDSIAVFPVVDYSSTAEDPSEFYTGFISIAKKVYRNSGKRVHFIPIHNQMDTHTLTIGKGVEYDPDRPHKDEVRRICTAMTNFIYFQEENETELIPPSNPHA